MGIQGLLKALEGVQRDVHITVFKGERVAIDASSWLHKGAYSCAKALVLGEPTTRHIDYCIRRIDSLIEFGLTPVVVFDGGSLPAKAEENQRREQVRREARDKAKGLMKMQKMEEAHKFFAQAVTITAEHAHELLLRLRAKNIEFIVAPYEADAQMTFLALIGWVSLVISEDSDLLVYGCPKVLYKYDESGRGRLIDLKDVPQARGFKALGRYSHDLFQQVSIMAGCDYLCSVDKVGIKTAAKLSGQFKTDIAKIIKAMRLQGLNVPNDYDVGYAQAKMTFTHQTVYDPRHHCLARVHPIPDDSRHGFEDLDFLGPWLADPIAHGIATGDLHPHTHEPFPANNTQAPATKQTKLPFLPIGDAPAPAAPAAAGGQGKGKNDHHQKPKGGVKVSSKGGAAGKQPSILQWARKEDKKGSRDGQDDDCEITGEAEPPLVDLGRRLGFDKATWQKGMGIKNTAACRNNKPPPQPHKNKDKEGKDNHTGAKLPPLGMLAAHNRARMVKRNQSTAAAPKSPPLPPFKAVFLNGPSPPPDSPIDIDSPSGQDVSHAPAPARARPLPAAKQDHDQEKDKDNNEGERVRRPLFGAKKPVNLKLSGSKLNADAVYCLYNVTMDEHGDAEDGRPQGMVAKMKAYAQGKLPSALARGKEAGGTPQDVDVAEEAQGVAQQQQQQQQQQKRPLPRVASAAPPPPAKKPCPADLSAFVYRSHDGHQQPPSRFGPARQQQHGGTVPHDHPMQHDDSGACEPMQQHDDACELEEAMMMEEEAEAEAEAEAIDVEDEAREIELDAEVMAEEAEFMRQRAMMIREGVIRDGVIDREAVARQYWPLAANEHLAVMGRSLVVLEDQFPPYRPRALTQILKTYPGRFAYPLEDHVPLYPDSYGRNDLAASGRQESPPLAQRHNLFQQALRERQAEELGEEQDTGTFPVPRSDRLDHLDSFGYRPPVARSRGGLFAGALKARRREKEQSLNGVSVSGMSKSALAAHYRILARRRIEEEEEEEEAKLRGNGLWYGRGDTMCEERHQRAAPIAMETADDAAAATPPHDSGEPMAEKAGEEGEEAAVEQQDIAADGPEQPQVNRPGGESDAMLDIDVSIDPDEGADANGGGDGDILEEYDAVRRDRPQPAPPIDEAKKDDRPASDPPTADKSPPAAAAPAAPPAAPDRAADVPKKFRAAKDKKAPPAASVKVKKEVAGNGEGERGGGKKGAAREDRGRKEARGRQTKEAVAEKQTEQTDNQDDEEGMVVSSAAFLDKLQSFVYKAKRQDK